MKCIEIEKLFDEFAGDELDFAVRRKVDSHLRECAACRNAAENRQSAAQLLKNLPLIAPPKQLDARVMQAFRKHQETHNQPSFRTAFFERFSISKPALACAALILVAFTALAFQLGRISASSNEVASSKNIESVAPVVQVIEKRVEIPVIKTVEIPVYKEKKVNRIIYKKIETPKTASEFRTLSLDSQNAAIRSKPGRAFIEPLTLEGFQPVSELKIQTIIKERRQ